MASRWALAVTGNNVQPAWMSEARLRQSGSVLAIQGGGAHGAFAWGAVDRLLADGVRFDAFSGVSSGAMIAAMAVQGFVHDGANGARAAMRQLWQAVGAANIFSPANAATEWLWGWDKGLGLGQELAWQGLTNVLRLFSPSQLNPLGQNPLQPLLESLLDIDAIRDASAPRLYVAATDVETGLHRIFGNAEIGVDVLLASACIPMMFPAVKIDGRHYWDGGYSCNPPLSPLLPHAPDHLVLVRCQPRLRHGVPTSTADIVHRLHEIAFQAPLDAELALLPQSIRLQEVPAEVLSEHPLTSKMNTEREFLQQLFRAGQQAAGLTMTA
jgi:NTE family protein